MEPTELLKQLPKPAQVVVNPLAEFIHPITEKLGLQHDIVALVIVVVVILLMIRVIMYSITAYFGQRRLRSVFQYVFERYPELAGTSVRLHYGFLWYATMTARPRIGSLFTRTVRYIIRVNSRSVFTRYTVPVLAIQDRDILIGWLAHELGHDVQYKTATRLELLVLPIRFFLSKSFKKDFETGANTIAINHGFERELKLHHEFLLNHPKISNEYKQRIRDFYQIVE